MDKGKGSETEEDFLWSLSESTCILEVLDKSAMIGAGMHVSKSDPCLFVSKKVIAVAFVDDILFWSSDVGYIDELGSKFRAQDLLLEQEDDAAGFLGVKMT